MSSDGGSCREWRQPYFALIRCTAFAIVAQFTIYSDMMNDYIDIQIVNNYFIIHIYFVLYWCLTYFVSVWVFKSVLSNWCCLFVVWLKLLVLSYSFWILKILNYFDWILYIINQCSTIYFIFILSPWCSFLSLFRLEVSCLLVLVVALI